jgi:hypothetical protein
MARDDPDLLARPWVIAPADFARSACGQAYSAAARQPLD